MRNEATVEGLADEVVDETEPDWIDECPRAQPAARPEQLKT